MRYSREQKAEITRRRMVDELRKDLQEICRIAGSKLLYKLNNGQVALIKRDMYELRNLMVDCVANRPAFPNTTNLSRAEPPLLKRIKKNVAKKAEPPAAELSGNNADRPAPP